MLVNFLNDDSLFLFTEKQAFFVKEIRVIFREKEGFEQAHVECTESRRRILIIRVRNHPNLKETTGKESVKRVRSAESYPLIICG